MYSNAYSTPLHVRWEDKEVRKILQRIDKKIETDPFVINKPVYPHEFEILHNTITNPIEKERCTHAIPWRGYVICCLPFTGQTVSDNKQGE